VARLRKEKHENAPSSRFYWHFIGTDIASVQPVTRRGVIEWVLNYLAHLDVTRESAASVPSAKVSIESKAVRDLVT
jgi:hypothetical protein